MTKKDGTGRDRNERSINREARLEAELRANLKKRKTLSRARAHPDVSDGQRRDGVTSPLPGNTEKQG